MDAGRMLGIDVRGQKRVPERKIDRCRVCRVVLLPPGPEFSFWRRLPYGRDAQTHHTDNASLERAHKQPPLPFGDREIHMSSWHAALSSPHPLWSAKMPWVAHTAWNLLQRVLELGTTAPLGNPDGR